MVKESSREEYEKEIRFKKISEIKKRDKIKDPRELEIEYRKVVIEFNTRIDNVKQDLDRYFVDLILDKNSRKNILEKEISHPLMRTSYIAQRADDFIKNTEMLITNYAQMNENRENFNIELRFFMECGFEIIKELKTMIEKLQKDIKLSKGEDWEEDYRIKVYNQIKEIIGDKHIGARVGYMKQVIERGVEDDAIRKKKKKDIIEEEYEKIKKETNNKLKED